MGISWRPKIGEKGPARKCDVSCAETSFEGLHFVVDDHILNTIIDAAAIRRFRIRHRLGSTITRSTPQQKTSTRRHDPALHAPAQDIRPSHRASPELKMKPQMSRQAATKPARTRGPDFSHACVSICVRRGRPQRSLVHFVDDDDTINAIVAAAIDLLGSIIKHGTPQHKTLSWKHDHAEHAPAKDIDSETRSSSARTCNSHPSEPSRKP